jgi:hypothetical protein
MAIRLGKLWLLSAALMALVPSWSQAADKESILALSRKIDAYIAAKQQEAGVIPAGRADDSTYFRRLNLDLVGRIPNLLDHRNFLDDNDPDKRWMWVDRFLGVDDDPFNKKYNEDYFTKTFARHFGTILRTHILGSNVNQQFAGFAPGFEKWLQDKLQSNTPYNQIVREILTSGNGDPLVARVALVNGAGNANPNAFFIVNENKPENLAGAATRKFLGVKLECAQCHAHPFAKWTRDQFWEFAAFFSGMQPNGVRAINAAAVPAAQPRERGREIQIPGTAKTVKARFLDGQEPAWKEKDSATAVLADWITADDNPYFARATVDLLWTHFFGASLLEPIMEPDADNGIVYPELLDEMARQFIAAKYDLKFLIKAIVHTEAYQRASTGTSKATKEDYALLARMPVRGLTPEQLFDSVAEATDYRAFDPNANLVNRPFNPPNSPRAQFLSKFTNQERRHETQTSILQALFLMNGKFLAERLRPENNESLKTLAYPAQPLPAQKRVETLYIWVLNRPPRPDEVENIVRYIETGGVTGDSGQAMADVYWALLNSAEFLLNH